MCIKCDTSFADIMTDALLYFNGTVNTTPKKLETCVIYRLSEQFRLEQLTLPVENPDDLVDILLIKPTKYLLYLD
jgi:hypothetical protein